MEDTDKSDESNETLAQQFTSVKGAVTKSHVQRYGDFGFVSSPLAAFLGNERKAKRSTAVNQSGMAVDSRDARVHFLRWRVDELRAKSMASGKELLEAEQELAAEEASRTVAISLFGTVWSRMSGAKAISALDLYMPPRNFDCHREVVKSARVTYTDFSFKYHRVIVNLCELGFDSKNITKNFEIARNMV